MGIVIMSGMRKLSLELHRGLVGWNAGTNEIIV
jgi:hypothetical protein